MSAVVGRTLILALLSGGPLSSKLPAQSDGAVPSMRLVSGTLSFDGHATVGDFVGKTSTVTGEMTGGESLTTVRGWVEAPVKTLDTENRKRDKDLNKSMESDKYPTMRFELVGVATGADRSAPASTGQAGTPVQLQGKLTLHGVTRDVTVPAKVSREGGGIRLKSDFPVNLKEYKIGGLTKALGMLRMQEGIEVHVDLNFAP